MRRWPWAGPLSLLLLIALDRVLFGWLDPWPLLVSRSDPRDRPYHQVARGRAQLRELAARPAGRPALVFVGTSRADVALHRATTRRLLPGVEVGEVAFAAQRPFELRSGADDLVDARVDVAVLLVSEFDTHRPLRLDPLPGTGVASLEALAELAWAAGPRFAWEQRWLWSRIPLSALLDLYRFRENLRRAGADRLRRFPLAEGRHPERDAASAPAALGPAAARLPQQASEELARDFPPARRPGVRFQAFMVAEIARGPHVAVQEALLASAVRRLREGGVQVVLAETPLHPAAAAFYESALRGDFEALARRLEAQEGAHFIAREAFGSFARDEFRDVLHLNGRGAAHFSRVVAQAAAPLLRIR